MKLIGVDLGGTFVRAGLIENDSILRIKSTGINSKGTEAQVLEDIFSVIDGIITSDIEGIGVGVPSVVDPEKGIVYDVYNIPSWKAVPLKNILEEKYNIKTVINNDANCFALGEKYYGKGRNVKNIVGLIIGTGMGAGIIVNGKLYSGPNCGAGEFGMIPYKDDILEHYCSGAYFKKYHNISGEELFDLALKNDKDAIKIYEEYAINLANAVKIILYSLDPEMIIFGGSVSKSFAFFKDALWKNIADFGYPQSLKNLKIEATELENIAILGAAALLPDSQF